MKKLILCIFTLAVFMFSSVTASAASGNVEKYEDDYVSIGANWESVEDGVIAHGWIKIKLFWYEIQGFQQGCDICC